MTLLNKIKSNKHPLLIGALGLLFIFQSCQEEDNKNNTNTTNVVVNCPTGATEVVGQGSPLTKTLTLDAIDGIVSFIPNKITITQGSTQEITATGHANIIDKLSTSVDKGVWEVKFADNSCYKNYELSIDIKIPSLSKVDLHSLEEIELNGFENTELLNITMTGGGAINANSQDLGSPSKLTITNTSAGNLNFFNLRVDSCYIISTGTGSCNVHVTSKLDVAISGPGNISYKGNPSITEDIKGTGKLLDAN